MPSGNGGMGRGSDTRIYSPRSESNHMYSNNDDDSYRHGIGDKEEFERKRDEKMREKEETKTVGDTPHLRIEIDKPEEDPMMGDMGSPQEEENPDMYNPEQAAAQTDMSSMAGPIGIGGSNLSQAIGAQTNGVMQQFATGEPMDLAFRLLKGGVKDILTSVMEIGPSATIHDLVNNGMSPDDAKNMVSQATATIDANPQDYSYNPNLQQKSEPMDGAWSTLLKEDDVPDMSNFGAPYDPDTRIPQLSMDDLYRLLQHPNSRIRHKANEEMQMRSMDAEGSNLPFDETTPAGEVAAFYEPQFKNLKYGNQQPPSLEEGDYNEEGYDEHYSQERAGDVLDAMPGDIEFFPSLAAKYEHLKNTAPPDVVENYRNRIKDFFDNYTQPSEIFGTTLPPQFTPKLPKETFYTPEEVMQQSDKINEAFNIYPGGNRAYTGFTDKFQNKLASEPMDGAWSTLMKARDQSWQQPKFDGPPGGRKPHIATSIRSKRQSRTLNPRTEHGGLTEAPLAVEMGHLGLSTKQPLRLFPGKYRQQLGQRHQRALMGNISMPHQPHNIEQRTPTTPGPMGSGKIPRLAGEMAGVKSRPKAVVKAPRPTDEFGNELPLHVQPESDKAAYIRYMQSLQRQGLPFPPNPLKPKQTMKAELQEMNTLLKSAKDYLHISQLRRIIRDMKKIVERQDRMKKAPLSRGSNKNKEAGHRGESTNPQGATDDPESDEMSSSGMPGHVFAARGSGRVA